MSNISKRKGAISIVLLWSVIFFIVILLCTFAIEIYYINLKAEIAKDAVTMAALSVYESIDETALDDKNIKANQAMKNSFKKYLAKNMQLDDNLNARKNSIAVGKVHLVDFYVYNSNDIEEYYPNGDKINFKPSLYVGIQYDIEPLLKGILGSKKTVYTSATADLTR